MNGTSVQKSLLIHQQAQIHGTRHEALVLSDWWLFEKRHQDNEGVVSAAGLEALDYSFFEWG